MTPFSRVPPVTHYHDFSTFVANITIAHDVYVYVYVYAASSSVSGQVLLLFGNWKNETILCKTLLEDP